MDAVAIRAPKSPRKRSDAVRNRAAILSSAISVLADTPTASMREIAVASGTGRTTLYRHFPDRDALIAAIVDRIFAEARVLTARALSEAGDHDPVEVMSDLSVELAGLGDRYRFLAQLPHHDRLADRPDATRRRAPLLRYLRAAQISGRVRSDLDAEWLLDALIALVTQAAASSHSGVPVTREHLRRTTRSLFDVPPAPHLTPCDPGDPSQ
jgi:AcrR family transcriptional regulator